jgi:hypothetical protein
MSGSGHYVKYDLAINVVHVDYVLCQMPAAVCADSVNCCHSCSLFIPEKDI